MIRDNSKIPRRGHSLEEDWNAGRRAPMTATITPAIGMPGAVRNDPETRLTDYMNAISFYLSTSDRIINQVVLLENSDYNLDEFYAMRRNLDCKKVLNAIIPPSSYDGRRGKGYAEFMMIDEGVKKLLSEGHSHGIYCPVEGYGKAYHSEYSRNLSRACQDRWRFIAI